MEEITIEQKSRKRNIKDITGGYVNTEGILIKGQLQQKIVFINKNFENGILVIDENNKPRTMFHYLSSPVEYKENDLLLLLSKYTNENIIYVLTGIDHINERISYYCF